MSATRQELLRTRRRLARVHKGIELLRRKREALVTEFFRQARPAVEARRRVREAAQAAHRSGLEALSARGVAALRAGGWPARDLEVEVALEPVWGVGVPRKLEVPELRRTLGARATAPGVAGPAELFAADAYEELVARVLEAAPSELLLRGLSQALAKTTRQLHVLEQRLLPRLRAEQTALTRTLDEREREEQARLRFLATPGGSAASTPSSRESASAG